MSNPTHREEINLYEAIQKTFPKILIKDLTEHERICPVCNGLGMRIENNIYGIKGDDSEAGRREHFPYKHQALSFCRSCYNGVQRLCPYCGQPYKNQGYTHCDCAGQKNADKEKSIKEWNEKFSKAVEVDEKDVDTMLYCEEFDEYYVQSCGSSVLFKDTRLEMLDIPNELNTKEASREDGYDVSVSGRPIGTYYGLKNWWYDMREKGQHGQKLILIQSQDGYNIGAFMGNDVTWEVEENLPKTTKIMIDGLPLYVHRCNFTIIDSKLIAK